MDFNIIEMVGNNIEISTVLFCAVIGIIYNNYFKDQNKHLPLLVMILGIFFSVWNHEWSVTPNIVLMGMISGVASTGFHQIFKQYFGKAHITDLNEYEEYDYHEEEVDSEGL